MTDTHYAADLLTRLEAAKRWAARVEQERPNDHQAIARAHAYVRRLKAQAREAI